MKNNLCCLLFLLLTCKLFPQNDIKDLIKQGLTYSYNFHLKKAEETFNKIILRNPNDPQGYHYIAGIYLWIYLSNKEKDDYEKFLKYSDMAIEKASKILDEKEDDETSLYILGADYGFRAMAFMKSNSYINAVWAIKNSNKYLKETLEKYPENYDAYLGLGLFNYALSLVPGVFKWVLKMAGLSGDRDEGISFLKYAYRNGNFTKTEAAYYLSQIYSETLIDYNAAQGYLKQLLKEFPNNILFQYSYAVVLIKSRKSEDAQKILIQIIKEDDPHFKQITSFSNFLIGEILFRENDFYSAIGYYDKFISSTREIDYTGIACYRMALCYEITGRREDGKKYYIFAGNGNLDIQDDAYAKRKGEIYINRSVSANEISVVEASNMIESSKFQIAEDSLIVLIPRIVSEKLKAEAYLYLCDVNFELGKNEESIESGIKAANFDTGDETWIKPFAYYYIARAYLKSGNKSKTEDFLANADELNGYDYQTKLTAFANALKVKLASQN